MLSMELLRADPDRVRRSCRARGEEYDVEQVLGLDARRRELIKEAEALKHNRNETSKAISELKRAGKDTERLIREMKQVSQGIKELDSSLSSVTRERDDLIARLPNILAEGVPEGTDPALNEVVREGGEEPEFSFEPKAHWDICKGLDIIDFERGGKVAASAFPFYKGLGARLERSLINFMLDLHTREHGYTELLPPFLASRKSMFGTGQLPKLEDDMYHLDRDDLFLIPTAEVPITNLHAGEVFAREDLPRKYCAYSACFRREAGAYGRETRALLRVHQFNKVELVKFARPEESYDELEALLSDAEEVVKRLGLRYRVLKLCAGEMSSAAAKCYDIELWAPGAKKWLEVSSCSNFEEYQARRANIRFRDSGKVRFCHTLNGSGVATPRLAAALLEHYQEEDGSVRLPAALQEQMGGLERIGG